MRDVTLLGLFLLLLLGCDFLPASGQLQLEYDFNQGSQGWKAGFADYSPGMEADMRLEAEIRNLPAELGAGKGYFIGGTNLSDDLFMYLACRVGPADGVMPCTEYQVKFVITFASNAPSGCMGIGGAPGESVILKAGAAPVRPRYYEAGDGAWQLNIDKGQQTEGGVDMSVVGDIANGLPCEQVIEDPPYVRLQRTHTHTRAVRSSPFGELWLIIGTDSGFEGRTELYYEHIAVELTPR